MHWFESAVYFSSAPMVAPFVPLWLARLTVKGLVLAPLQGHSGFGSFDSETSCNHYIHHAKFNVRLRYHASQRLCRPHAFCMLVTAVELRVFGHVGQDHGYRLRLACRGERSPGDGSSSRRQRAGRAVRSCRGRRRAGGARGCH